MHNQEAPLSFGSWLESQPLEPHNVPPGRQDTWPDRMVWKYQRYLDSYYGGTIEQVQRFRQDTLFEGVIA